jgi:hypothetical protein
MKREILKMMNINDYKNLIKIAQEGKSIMADIAVNDILADIMQYRMNPIIGKYKNKLTSGSMLDYDDIQQIFMIACSKAIYEADTEIGNPMLFLLQKGRWAVIDALRMTYRQTIKQFCHICHSTTRLNEKGGIPICPKCGAEGHEHISREQMVNQDDGTVLNQVACTKQSIELEIEDKLLIEEFKTRLNGRKLEIFELIMDYGYDRDNCKNYIKEIADKLGVGQSNVNLRLRAIKQVLTEFLAENRDIM